MIEKQRTILDNKERITYIQDMQVKMSQWFQTVPYHGRGGYVYSQPWVKNFYYKAGYAYVADSRHEVVLHAGAHRQGLSRNVPEGGRLEPRRPPFRAR